MVQADRSTLENAKILHSITPVILAGGHGKRLRPLTSANRPKPFLKLFSKFSVFQDTIRSVSNFSQPFVTVNYHFAQRVLRECMVVGINPARVLCEPSSRSTAISIAMAALTLEHSNQTLLILPSDHYVEDRALLNDAIVDAYRQLPNDGFCIVGAKVRNPSTRYGYLEVEQSEGVFRLKQFLEKPDYTAAKHLYKRSLAGQCFWNTGIFLVKPGVYLSHLQKCHSVLYGYAKQAYQLHRDDAPFLYPEADSWLDAPSSSVDYAVMEHVKQANVIPLHTQWHDIGCWSSLIRVKLRALL